MTALPNGVASTTSSTFSRTTQVAIAVNAEAPSIWHLLTTASDYPRWNSTVVSIEGEILSGSKIKLVSTLDPSRTFSLKVKTFEENSTLAWGDALGTRTYTLTPIAEGGTSVEIVEKIGGPIFPLFASKIPSFDESFTQFAADLKTAAEQPKV
ncbi:uncharacterized protein YndB with AHSA1/START domain [Psychromicrobium silvestre]|uniref:Uncharacterized protein YndB with AHSA1/START domain n=1 Tax=Psychromicrobium silvestre TaxID=1645614 RepID=A0A7Y9LUI5_9MICC|nr:SRPBCC domain-containing protein [Psychromicrobium silvestre]NYE95790.1 uncharacterized protein YndB with AHSA1/START domain [Psychromicrobium silvestre]